MKIRLPFLFFITHFYIIPSILYATTDLTTLMLRYDTDKGPSNHNYGPIYEFYFSSLRDKPLKFLEIGFLYGASARVWEQYFPNASLYFIDNTKTYFARYGKDLSSRCHLCVADQGNKKDLINFIQASGGQFDIIIDDGGHKMHQQITSFETLFPQVTSGGIYVIEDLHTSYWADWGGSGSIGNPQTNNTSTIRFLQSLIDDVNFIGAMTGCADRRKCPENIRQNLSFYQSSIKSIHFYNSICFIIKN